MPRQRVIQSNVESAPGVKTHGATRSLNEEESSRGDKDESQGATVLNGNQPEGRSNEAVNEKEKEKETSKYSEKILDMSIKLKVHTTRDIRVCTCVRVCGNSSTITRR